MCMCVYIYVPQYFMKYIVYIMKYIVFIFRIISFA